MDTNTDRDTRRPISLDAMKRRHKQLRAAMNAPETETRKKRIIRTNLAIRQYTASSQAMRAACDSARGNLGATIVYIDLLYHLPQTVPHPDKENQPYKHPRWRNLSVQATACYYQLGAATIEADTEYTLVPFTWNLSQSLWRAAKDNNEDDVTYLQHRLKTALRRALCRSVDFWFSYEVNDKALISGKPHLHGSLLIKSSEAKKARNVFHRLNGDVSTDFKRHAIRFSSGDRKIRIEKYGALHVNLNWALYCMKERGIVRRYYLIKQNTFTATHGITQAAKRYYFQIKPTKTASKPVNPLYGSW